jgi:HEAT repeat protein
VTKKHVLLSYRSLEAEFALRLGTDLKNAGVNLWMDRLDIKPGDDWLKALQQGLNNCAALIPILSPEYVASKYCQRELARADRMERPIFPVLIKAIPESEWPFEVERRQYIDFSQWRDEAVYREQFEKLVDILKARVADQISEMPDPEVRYINNLIASLKSRTGVISHFEQDGLEEGSLRRRPVLAETWDLPGRYAVVHDPAQAQAPNAPTRRYPLPLKGIHEAVEKYPCFALVGQPAIGKSMTVRYLVLEAAHRYLAAPRAAPIPLLLNFSQWQNESTPLEFIRKHWTLDSEPSKLLVKGKIALFLEGLNSLSDDKVDALRDWISSPQAPQRMVITSRSDDYEQVLRLNIPVVEISVLDTAQTRTFVVHYLQEEGAQAFLKQILPQSADDNRRLRHRQMMARNPFLLSALIKFYETASGEELPHSVGATVRWLVGQMWEQKQSTHPAAEFDSVESVLTDLAFAMVDQDMPSAIPMVDAMEYLGSDVSLDLAVEASLLEIEGNLLRFSHELLMQYFAALGLVRVGVLTRLTSPRFDETMARIPQKWDLPVLLLTGMVPHPDSIVLNVADVDPYFALSCALSGADISDRTYQMVVDRLFEMMRVHVEGRVAGARILRDIDPDKAVLILLEVMRDPMWNVRHAASLALSEIRLPLKDALVQAIDDLEDANRETTLTALRQMGTDALPTLLQLVQDTNWHRRRGAAWALGELRDTAAVPLLVDRLHDPEHLVRTAAATALGQVKDAGAIPMLVTALDDENWRTGKAASKALALIGKPALSDLIAILKQKDAPTRRQTRAIDALAYIHDDQVLDVLLNATSARNVEIRMAAVDALREQKNPAATKRLIECLSDTSKPRSSKQRVCDMAVSALLAIGTDEAVAAVKNWRADEPPRRATTSGREGKDRLNRLINGSPSRSLPFDPVESLADQDWMARRDAILGLATASPSEAMPHLLAALSDEDSQVRMSAVNTLAVFKDSPQVIPTLVNALGDEDYLVSDAAKESLKKICAPPAPELVSAIHNANLNIRAAAIEILGAIKDVGAVPEIIDCMTDIRRPWLSDQSISDIAALALQSIGTPLALDTFRQWEQARPNRSARRGPEAGVDENHHDILGDILTNLHDENWDTRQDAAKSLREYARLLRGSGDAEVIKRLVVVLKDEDWVARWAATEALAWIRDPSPVRAMAELIKDPVWTVRAAAIRSLAEIGHTSILADIAAALSDSNTNVREAAAEALGNLGDLSVIDNLVTALKDPEQFVRIAAIEALGKLKDARSVTVLIGAATDADPVIRWFAAGSLGLIADPSAVPVLAALLEDEEGPYWEERRICHIAAVSLEAIDTPEARKAVNDWRSKQAIQ